MTQHDPIVAAGLIFIGRERAADLTPHTGNGKMRMPVGEVKTLFRRLAIPAVKALLR